MAEKDLIIGLKEGNEYAFRKLIEAYGDRVYNTVLSIVQQKEDAEDIAQDVFISVYNSINDFAGNSALSTWIYRIAVNRSLDAIRRRKRQKRFGFITNFCDSHEQPQSLTDFRHPGVAAEQKENAAALFFAVRQLPENQQAAFVLNKAEGLSYKKIAGILSISESAVDSLLQRAKQNLRKIIDKNIL